MGNNGDKKNYKIPKLKAKWPKNRNYPTKQEILSENWKNRNA